MTLSVVQRPSSPILMSSFIADQIKRAQALKMPFIRYEKFESDDIFPNPGIIKRIYLIECFSIKPRPDRETPSLARIHYEGIYIAPYRIITISRDISESDRTVIELATDLLAHQDLVTEGDLRRHLAEEPCDLCHLVTDAILKLGVYISGVANPLPDGSDQKELFKKYSKVILHCAARRENLFDRLFLEKHLVNVSTPIHDVESTPYPQLQVDRPRSRFDDPESPSVVPMFVYGSSDVTSPPVRTWRSSSVMKGTAGRSGRASTTPFSRSASRSSSRPSSEQALRSHNGVNAGCIRPVPLSPKKK